MNDTNLTYFGLSRDYVEGIGLVHDLTVRFRDKLFTNYALQNVLLNDGYDYKENSERPISFFDLGDAVWIRSMTLGHLSYLRLVIDKVTKPFLVIPKIPLIDTSGRTCLVFPNDLADSLTPITLSASGDINPEKLEAYQRLWFEEDEVRNDVRAFEKRLAEAFDVFNLNYVRTKILNAPHFAPYEGEEVGIIDEISKVRGFREAFGELDDAYYSNARSLYGGCNSLWSKLNSSESGKLFILSQEEIREFLKKYTSRMVE